MAANGIVVAGHSCFIGLGSNIGDGPAIIAKACAELADTAGVEWVRRSSLYRSAAWGRTDQADFTNAVAEIRTTLQPGELLQALLRIESGLGRSRETGQWGPRTIDLDLLCYADWQVNAEELSVPHRRMHLRAFVLVPLLELEPEFAIPGVGKARELLEKLEPQQVQIFV